MHPTTKKKWYAIYTRPRWEKKVAELLSKKNIENYCPLNKVVNQWWDRKKVIYEPLFSSYVFVNAMEAEHLSIKQTSGVINFVYWLGTPASIKDDEIEAIKDFLDVHQNVILEKSKVNVNDKVKIMSGPFKEHEGSVLEIKKNTLKVFLPSLGYVMSAEVEKANVQVMDRSVIFSKKSTSLIKIFR
jgi:transcription antitermination factor NusG